MSSSQRFSRNIRLFYIQQFLVGLATLWVPIIVIFQMQEVGLSLTQVMVGESIFSATIVLFEVPSGVNRQNNESVALWIIIQAGTRE